MLPYLFHVICTTSFSMSSASPFSSGSAIMVILFLPITHRHNYIFQPNQPSLRRWWQHAVKLSEHTTAVQRLHLFFILFIGRFSETLQGGRLHHSLTEGHHRVSYLWWKPKVEIIYSDKWVNICEQKKHLDVNLRVHLPQVVHDTVQVQLTCAKNHMFSRLLHLKRQNTKQISMLKKNSS